MKDNAKFWKIAEIILGAIGAALLVLILVLRLTGKDVTVFSYVIVGVVILFLIADEYARSIRRRHEKEAKTEQDSSPKEDPEGTLPKDAFDFEPDSKKEHP